MRALILLAWLVSASVAGADTFQVDVGPKTCVGGANDGAECHYNPDCASDNCSGSSTLHFFENRRECVGGSNAGSACNADDQCPGSTCGAAAGTTTTVAVGDTVQWDWVPSSPTHDVFGGVLCAGGSNNGNPCDDDKRACVGGSNVNGNCSTDVDCPSSTCGYSNCWVCTGGSNDGTACFTNGICTGGGTCNKSGTCTTTLAETFDASGPFGAPHTFTHTFNTVGTYPYVCAVHPGAPGVGMTGTVVVVGCNRTDQCDDANQCTTDACVSHTCTHTPLPENTACDDDGDHCTRDQCKAGVCTHTNICHKGGICTQSAGTCPGRPGIDAGAVLKPFGPTREGGSVFYVDQANAKAADTNDGRTVGRPFRTIQAAVDAATSGVGDVIYVYDAHSETPLNTGDYYEVVTVGKDDVSIVGALTSPSRNFSQGTGVWLACNLGNASAGTPCLTVTGQRFRLIGIDVESDTGGPAVLQYGSAFSFEHDSFSSTTTGSGSAYGIKVSDGFNGQILDSVFEGSVDGSIAMVNSAVDLEIARCQFADFAGTGAPDITLSSNVGEIRIHDNIHLSDKSLYITTGACDYDSAQVCMISGSHFYGQLKNANKVVLGSNWAFVGNFDPKGIVDGTALAP